MTDLTPFVDNYFGEDRQLNELKVQLEGLEERDKIFMAVEVTGPGRNPIYARGKFDDGGHSEWKPDLWRVSLTSEAPCRFTDLRGLEIWICGSKKPGFPIGFMYGQNSPQALLGMNFAGPTVWINLGWTPEQLEDRNLNFDRSHDVMHHVFETLERADPERLCEITDLYQSIENYLPLVQSVSRARDTDALVSARNTVLESLRDLGVVEGMHLSLDPVGDRLMSSINMEGVDVHDQEALQAFLTNFGTQRIFGERSSFDEHDGGGLNAL